MLTFSLYLTEAKEGVEPDKGGSKHNEVMGRVYERATALGVHENTGARNNKNPEYLKRIMKMKEDQKNDLALLPPAVAQSALESAKRSHQAYLQSLQKNHKVDINKITEVLHTSKGIDDIVGKKVDRTQNPHDIAVKIGDGPKAVYHGASLKKTQGTLSNNLHGPFSSHGKDVTGIGHGTSDIWKAGIEAAGMGGMSAKQIKERRKDPGVIAAYKAAQKQVVQHHADSFNSGNLENQKKHLRYLMKLDYDKSVPYDYVNGERGKAVPIEDMDHTKAVNNAEGFTAVPKGTMTHIYDHNGNHILSVEHRATHGAFTSMQANAKLGSLKPPKEGIPAKPNVLADPQAAVSASKVPIKKVVSPGGFGEHRGDGPRHYQAYVDRSSHMGFKDNGL
jgi:hypothetical protein